MDSIQASRKVQLTINNPGNFGITHETLKTSILSMKSVTYYCMADEVGAEGTPHIHVFIAAKSPLRLNTLKQRFPQAHIEFARGTYEENRDYVAKSGRWANDPKRDTSLPGTYEEWGEMPAEVGQGHRSDIAAVYQQIEAGYSNAEIMAQNPNAAKFISNMDKIRQEILEERYRTTWRDLRVTYIFGPSRTGKTRGVMDTYGYADVYRVTDYAHPFDRYAQEPVLCLDEFHSGLPIEGMLNYLDGYPLNLPARYAHRVACFTLVFIISNIDLREQYLFTQDHDPETWKAFLRRIHYVVEYKKDGSTINHGDALNYIFPPSTK